METQMTHVTITFTSHLRMCHRYLTCGVWPVGHLLFLVVRRSRPRQVIQVPGLTGRVQGAGEVRRHRGPHSALGPHFHRPGHRTHMLGPRHHQAFLRKGVRGKELSKARPRWPGYSPDSLGPEGSQ